MDIKTMYPRLFDGYESMQLVRYDDSGALPARQAAYEDLGSTEIDGVLKSNNYIDGKLTGVYTEKDSHIGVIAATRLGKTTSYVIPNVLSMARRKNKRNMVLTDPKGEIYAATAATLKEEGYKVLIINFRDYLHSEYWNPITSIFRLKKSIDELANAIKPVKSQKGYELYFDGKTYSKRQDAEYAQSRKVNLMNSLLDMSVDNFARMIITTDCLKDPIWEDGARDLFKAFLYAMLEDTVNKDNPMTENTFSISTLISLAENISFRNSDFSAGASDGGYFSDRTSSSRAKRLAKNVILNTGRNTGSSFMSVFMAKLSEYREVTTRLITSCNSFEFNDLICDDPVALFIDFKDELKTQYSTIALLIQSLYTFLIGEADKTPRNRLERPWYFILDEFGNFPAITDFETVISACGGRNIWFMLVLQSYAQLDNVYGQNVSKIIRDNMNVHVFFGSNNPDTIKAFSEECGLVKRISPESAVNGDKSYMDRYVFETVPLVPQSMLRQLAPGECIVTEAQAGYVMLSKLERFFECPEFNALPRSNVGDYTSKVDPLSSEYNYKFIWR